MAIIKVSLGYHRTRVDEIDTFAVGVRDGIYNHPATFPMPLIDPLSFQSLINAYIDARGAAKVGGTAQTGPFNIARAAMMDALDEQAVYVDSIAQGDADIIRISGFKPTKGTGSKTLIPEQFENIKIKHGASGVLFAECEFQDGVDCHGCIVTAHDPIPADINITAAGQLIYKEQPTNDANTGGGANPIMPFPIQQLNMFIIDFTKPRKKKFMALTPGVTYYFVFYGINRAGVGPFSVTKSIVCY